MVYKMLLRNMLSIKPGTPGRIPALYTISALGNFTCLAQHTEPSALRPTTHGTIGSYVPSEGLGNNGLRQLLIMVYLEPLLIRTSSATTGPSIMLRNRIICKLFLVKPPCSKVVS